MSSQQSSHSNLDEVRQVLVNIADQHEGTDYSKLNHEELLVVSVDHIWLTYQCVLKILQKHKPSENHHREAFRILESRTDEDWIYLYQIHQDRRPIERLAR